MDSNIINFPRNRIGKPRPVENTVPDLSLEIRKLSDLVLDLVQRNRQLESIVDKLQKRLIKLALFTKYKE